MIPTTAELRELFHAWGGMSHDAECWRVHPKCDVALACDEIDRLLQSLEIAERALDDILLGWNLPVPAIDTSAKRVAEMRK